MFQNFEGHTRVYLKVGVAIENIWGTKTR